MFWPSIQPSCLIDIQNGFVETDFARSCGLGTGPMPRIPTRAVFSDFCASVASGASARPSPRMTRPIRRIGTSIGMAGRESSRTLRRAPARASTQNFGYRSRPRRSEVTVTNPSEEDTVTRASLREYAAVQRERYQQAPRRETHRLLDEIVAVTGLHRKAAIRLLRRAPRAAPSAPRAGRPRR